MNWEAFITCAVTGAGETTGKHPAIPTTPEEIATAALEAAEAGAAIAHIHVRDPETGKGARDPALYRKVVERVRAADTDVVLNLTAGMGGDIVFGRGETPLPLDQEGTDMAGPLERLAHVEELLPEICTLDCGTMNFAAGDYVMTNTPSMLRAGAQRVRELDVRPELEVFDTGHLVFVKTMIDEGLIDTPAMVQLCCGIPYGAPDDPGTLMAMVNQLPPATHWSAFLDRPHAATLRCDGGAGRRQRAGGSGGQHLSRTRGLRLQRPTRRACRRHPRGHERAYSRPRRGAREAFADTARLNSCDG